MNPIEGAWSHESMHYYTPEESDFLVDMYDHDTEHAWNMLNAQDIIDVGRLREDSVLFIDIITDNGKGLIEWFGTN